jgi:hypothetical protein
MRFAFGAVTRPDGLRRPGAFSRLFDRTANLRDRCAQGVQRVIQLLFFSGRLHASFSLNLFGPPLLFGPAFVAGFFPAYRHRHLKNRCPVVACF